MKRQQPLISIITSTYNAGELLSITARSIRNQTYMGSFEWIIIDGASKDNTVEVIKENEDIISCWLSEKDNGIYDAWNKALKLISGKWVLFIGAGDFFYSNSVLEEMSCHLKRETSGNLLYGKVQLVSEDYKHEYRLWGKPWDKLKNKWESIRPALPPHPASFINASIFTKDGYTFPLKYQISGDSHLLITLISKQDPVFIPIIVDVMPHGGVSTNTKNQTRLIKELKNMNEEFDFNMTKSKYFCKYLKAYLFFYMNNFFSTNITHLILKIYKKNV